MACLTLESILQFPLHQAIDSTDDSVFHSFAQKHAEHRRHGGGQGDRRRVECGSHFRDDMFQFGFHVRQRQTAECRSEMNDRSQKSQDRSHGDDESNQRIVMEGRVVILFRQVPQVIRKFFGGLVLDDIGQGMDQALSDSGKGQLGRYAIELVRAIQPLE